MAETKVRKKKAPEEKKSGKKASKAAKPAKSEKKIQDIAEHKYLFHHGKNYRSYELFGAHRIGPDEEDGYRFRVWAPRAAAVMLIGEFNNWDENSLPMARLSDDDSIFEIEVPEAREGQLYKFLIRTDDGRSLYKADPYAFYSENPLATWGQRASRIWNIDRPFAWKDEEWQKERGRRNPYTSPMNIYEVHAGSWRRHEDGSLYNWKELADELVPYVKKMGYTHMELLPVMEHPYDGSWGYQITGYYSITARYGDPDGFKYFIDKAHRAGIGVILDWVPAHFPKDEYGLVEFDGHPLYEYTDPLKMEHKGWGTRAFDFGRPEVISFLVSNAFFLCGQYHADGLRVDAVAAMLYLNYDRPDGEWTPNDEGGTENKETVAFLQRLNQDVQTGFPGVMIIAEESTAWPNVTRPPQIGGLGFNFKWNMGWMNDTLSYFSTDPYFRSGIHNRLSFAITYAYSENFIMPVSHDEVVHGKCSLLNKMPGEYDDKFAGVRSFLVYMATHPGKMLTFMGTELAQFIEWDEKRELDWMLLDYEKHAKMHDFVKELNHYYLNTPALWAKDDSYDGFRWIDADNYKANVYTYYRTSKGPEKDVVLVALNLSGKDFPEYDIGVPAADHYAVAIDTDLKRAGGNAVRRKRVYKVVKGECNGYEQHITVPLPKLSAIILEKREKKEVKA